jgi:hypothetical protein
MPVPSSMVVSVLLIMNVIDVRVWWVVSLVSTFRFEKLMGTLINKYRGRGPIQVQGGGSQRTHVIAVALLNARVWSFHDH